MTDFGKLLTYLEQMEVALEQARQRAEVAQELAETENHIKVNSISDESRNQDSDEWRDWFSESD